MKNKKWIILYSLLAAGILLAIYLYLTANTRGQPTFALRLRSQRLLPFIFVGTASATATIIFQTMTQNVILTPSIIGLESLYIFLQTAGLFFLGTEHWLTTDARLNFIFSLLMMAIASVLLFGLFFKIQPGNLYLILAVGIIMGTLFSSLTQFLQVIIDPNEYDQLFARTVASFNRVEISLTLLSIMVILPVLIYLYSERNRLDVLHLGNPAASSLGIEVDRYQLVLFLMVSLLTAAATALVGPISFLGFIGAHIAYRLFGTYRHTVLLTGASLITILFILVGQLLVEHLFKLRVTLGVIIQFVGGIYFLLILLREGRGVHD
ncbi:Iron compound ABC uptake transporter permease protein [Alkalibacterium sp. AK22]|uniref:iron chelate uptake ABC transporter family permease subunit n=1 Tax=Alkalibacterium sp. AK22 TaxID=1229520 RepID=UPI00044B66EF|nr:iron chelate uptake ABC transporter family permease subunit [Alkalibacterium sp. AK22]EXJ22839.1 Iron compound ABC uptake transporter permease protein [Alkalibacterium sp. AK22]